jgi:hypothetical protein
MILGTLSHLLRLSSLHLLKLFYAFNLLLAIKII